MCESAAFDASAFVDEYLPGNMPISAIILDAELLPLCESAVARVARICKRSPTVRSAIVEGSKEHGGMLACAGLFEAVTHLVIAEDAHGTLAVEPTLAFTVRETDRQDVLRHVKCVLGSHRVANSDVRSSYFFSTVLAASYKSGELLALGCAAVALDLGADPNLNVDGDAALLHKCAEDGAVAFAGLLLDYGADINCRLIPEDTTPLMIAAAGKSAEMVRLLLQRGADAHYRRYDGHTAMTIAQEGSASDVIAALSVAARAK